MSYNSFCPMHPVYFAHRSKATAENISPHQYGGLPKRS